MDQERMRKLLVYCNNLPADERAALAKAMTASLSEDPNSEPIVAHAAFLGPWFDRADGTPHPHTLEFAFKRQSPIVVQITFTKEELKTVVAYCEQVYSEPEGRESIRFPIEPGR